MQSGLTKLLRRRWVFTLASSAAFVAALGLAAFAPFPETKAPVAPSAIDYLLTAKSLKVDGYVSGAKPFARVSLVVVATPRRLAKGDAKRSHASASTTPLVSKTIATADKRGRTAINATITLPRREWAHEPFFGIGSSGPR